MQRILCLARLCFSSRRAQLYSIYHVVRCQATRNFFICLSHSHEWTLRYGTFAARKKSQMVFSSSSTFVFFRFCIFFACLNKLFLFFVLQQSKSSRVKNNQQQHCLISGMWKSFLEIKIFCKIIRIRDQIEPNQTRNRLHEKAEEEGDQIANVSSL